MSKLTYSQLEGVWIQAGGSETLAPLMAAIALAESGGQSNAVNPTDNGGRQSSFGLWQISTGTHKEPSANWADPVENARLALGKYNSQGLKAWGTYTSGAYKRFLANGVPATAYASATTTVTGGGESAQVNTCAWSVSLPVVGNSCLLSKKNTRVLLGIVLTLGGVTVALVGAVLIVKYGIGGTAIGGELASGLGIGSGR